MGADERMKRAWRGARRRVLEIPLNIHPDRALRAVSRLRREHPNASLDELARRIMQRRVWTPAAIGFVTGAPSSPWAAGVLAAADVGLSMRHHIETACQIAVLYDPGFFEHDRAHWEVLVPVLGASREGRDWEASREQSAGVSQVVQEQLVRRMRRAAVRALGAMVVKKAVLGKAVPVVGGVIGGAWGLRDSFRIGDQILEYFAARHQLARARLPDGG